MRIATPKLKDLLRGWTWGLAVAGFAAPACLAQNVSVREHPEWAPAGWLALLLGLLALFAWQISAARGRNRARELRRKIEALEREKAEMARAQEKMIHFAEHDDLTGLWNRRIILQRLRGEVDRSRREGVPLSVMMVDLDNFKNVNDTFGHLVGDQVLKEIGAIFQRSVRSYDWVGRYGGEEFLLILPGTSFVSARLRAEQFRLAVQSARVVDGERTIAVTASFGVASGFPSDHEVMIPAADAALYRAKNNGRNCVVATEIEASESAG